MLMGGVLALLISLAGAATPPSEVAALRIFFDALGGSGWYLKHGWNSTRDPCGGAYFRVWHGVTCENATNATHIVGLTLEHVYYDDF